MPGTKRFFEHLANVYQECAGKVKQKVDDQKPLVKNVIHVSYRGQKTALQLTSRMSNEEVVDILLTAANFDSENASRYSISLCQEDGPAFSLDFEAIPENTEINPYILTIIDTDPEFLRSKEEQELENENRVVQLKQQLLELKNQVMSLDLTPIKVNVAVPVQQKAPTIDKKVNITKTRHFQEEKSYFFSDETKQILKTPTFDNWKWEDNEIIGLFELMFQELGLIEEFKIDPRTLRNFLYAVRENYRENPFHNFRHCFCVSQMVCICCFN